MKYKIVTENRDDIPCRTMASAARKLAKLRKVLPLIYYNSYIATVSGQRCYYNSLSDLVAQK